MYINHMVLATKIWCQDLVASCGVKPNLSVDLVSGDVLVAGANYHPSSRLQLEFVGNYDLPDSIHTLHVSVHTYIHTYTQCSMRLLVMGLVPLNSG